MQKKLEAELMSLAHSILKLKKGDDVRLLKEKAHEIYEKLAVLTFIESYVKETPQNTKSIEELVSGTFVTEELGVSDKEVKKELVSEVSNDVLVNKEAKVVKEQDVAKDEVEIESPVNLFSEVDMTQEKPKDLKSSLKEEFGDTISLDIATNIFENAERVIPKKSINDTIVQQKNLQIDLNDRIAFVKNLFEGSQEDFNRVISQLNTMTSEEEALSFFKLIKKDYDWNGGEVYEERLLLLIERKFN